MTPAEKKAAANAAKKGSMKEQITLEMFFSGINYRSSRGKLWEQNILKGTFQIKAEVCYSEVNDLVYLTILDPNGKNTLVYSGALSDEVQALSEEIGETVTIEVAWFNPVPNWTDEALRRDYGKDNIGKAAIANYLQAIEDKLSRLTLVGLVE